MTKIDDFLLPLCSEIKAKKLKSKQAAFNLYLSSILEAKRFYRWDQIAEYINTQTDSSVATRAYKCMVERAKKKGVIKNLVANEVVQNKKETKGNAFSSITKVDNQKKQTIEHNNNPDLEQLLEEIKAMKEPTPPKNPLAGLSKNVRAGDYNPTPDKKRIYGDQSDA